MYGHKVLIVLTPGCGTLFHPLIYDTDLSNSAAVGCIAAQCLNNRLILGGVVHAESIPEKVNLLCRPD